MTPAQYLYGMSEPVQAQVVELVRSVAGMSRHEKAVALGAFTGVCEALFERLEADDAAIIAGINAMSQLIAEIDRDGFPRDTQEVA